MNNITNILVAVVGSIRLFAFLVATCITPIAIADDLEIYEHGGCVKKEAYRFIFIVDNSGSMSSTDFNNSRATINAAARHVLVNSDLPDIKIAVVQYGTGYRGGQIDHDYRVSVPFTDNYRRATSWRRDFGGSGGYRPNYTEDHQPASLAKMRRDRVYDEGGALDVSDATNVQFIFFTDAHKDYRGCCSSIVAGGRNNIPSYVKSGYGEYNALKDGSVLPNELRAQFTLLHAAPDAESTRAGAAIASLGGEYTGTVDSNSGDPDGSGLTPRRYLHGNLTSADQSKVVTLLDEVFEEIKVASAFASPSVSTSSFNETRASDQMFYALFQPGQKKTWVGNVKSYRINDQGVVVDADGRAAVDSDKGSFLPDARSIWSAEEDGDDVGEGGFSALLGAPKTLYTDVGGVTRRITAAADVPISAVGASSSAQRDTAINWALGFDSVDYDDNKITAEPNHFIGDALHASPIKIKYNKSGSSTSDVLFATTNLGMLHAIEPKTGMPLWSYMPEELLPNLLEFNKESQDINDHNYGLDGPLAFYEKRATRTATSYSLNKGYLYLSQRRGGSNVFALDVSRARSSTNPFSVAWKIKGGEGQFKDLGQTWAAPELVSVAFNCNTGCRYRDVLLISGGYNPAYDNANYGYPTSPAGTKHGNALYMVHPETGQLLWSAGKSSGHSLQLDMRDSIPSAPVTIDNDGNGGIDIIYVTDIAGKIWRIDLDENASSFNSMHFGGGMIADLAVGGSVKQRFFNKPDVVMSTSGSSAAHFSIAVGSGMRSSPLTNETGQNSIYFVRDPWVRRNPVRLDQNSGDLKPDYRYVMENNSARIIRRSDLGQVSSSGGTLSFPNYGYYEDLKAAGEKVLAPTVTYGGKTLLVTFVPPSGISTNPEDCAYNLGTSRMYIYDVNASRFVPIKSTGTNSTDIAIGIVSQIVLIDTGGSSGVSVLTGLESTALSTLIDAESSNVRHIKRTSWVETEKPK